MNNLSSYCGLVDANIRASDKDLPVIMLLIIAAEEAIAKGIRRVVALTGPEAVKALNKAKLLENELGKVTVVINESKLGQKVCTDL